MSNVTTIQLPPRTRDRLKQFGRKGQTYAEILDAIMDRVAYEEFMEDQYERLQDRREFVPLKKT